MPGLIKDNWIHIYASAFNLLQYVSSVEMHEENLASPGISVEKGGVFK